MSLGLGLIGLAACTPTDGSPSGSEPSPSAVSSGAAASVSVHILGDEPVLTGTDVNNDWVLPGAVVWLDGTYHLYGVAFDQESTEHHGYYATSPDGTIWTVGAADPLAMLGLELGGPFPVPGSVLAEPDGSWVMYLWGVPAGGAQGADLYRATAHEPAGPWTASETPVLRATAGGWDSQGLTFPSVVRTSTGYLMLYVGSSLSTPNETRIGYAMSSDGITWSKGESPLIEPGFCGAFDARSVTIPRLRETDPGWLLFYNGLDESLGPAQVGVGQSADGLSWRCVSPEPALTAADIPDSQGIHTIAVAATARGPEFLVESIGDQSSSLWLGDVDMSGL
jgi:hypothetical protein